MVLRIQSLGETYELERKVDSTNLERDSEKITITYDEFEHLKNFSSEVIFRDSYIFSENPLIKLRVYHDAFVGLNRAEVSFSSLEEVQHFIPLSWFGPEITNTPLAKDADLLSLSQSEFKKLLQHS